MAQMIVELYDALKDAGADEEKAREAATAVADYDRRFTTLEQQIVALRGEMREGFAEARGDVRLLRWAVAVNTGLTLLVLGLLARLTFLLPATG